MLKGEPLGGHPRPMPALFSVDAMPEPPPPNFYMGIKPPPRELEPAEDPAIAASVGTALGELARDAIKARFNPPAPPAPPAPTRKRRSRK